MRQERSESVQHERRIAPHKNDQGQHCLGAGPFQTTLECDKSTSHYYNDYATGSTDTESVSVSVANKVLESPAVTAGNGPDDVPVPFAPSAVALKQLQNRRARTTKAKH